MMKVIVDYPSIKEEKEIINRANTQNDKKIKSVVKAKTILEHKFIASTAQQSCDPAIAPRSSNNRLLPAFEAREGGEAIDRPG